MATKVPPGSRDLVKFSVNERVDLPDMDAMQDNNRSETRNAFNQFLFGNGRKRWDSATNTWIEDLHYPHVPGTALTPGITNWDMTCVVGAPGVYIDGTNVTVFMYNYTSGGGGEWRAGVFGGAIRADTTHETGIGVVDGDDEQTIDMTGKPSGTYGVYITGTSEDGTPGSRVFWNNGTSSEDLVAVDTRKTAGWNMSVQLLSAGTTGSAPMLVRVFDWNDSTATISNEKNTWSSLFDGVWEQTGYTATTSGHMEHTEWGDGTYDRSEPDSGEYLHDSTRPQRYTTGSFREFGAIIRRQLGDIIGWDDTNGHRWYKKAVPTFVTGTATGGEALIAGTGVAMATVAGQTVMANERANLNAFRKHVQADENPHGHSLKQFELHIGNSSNTHNTDITGTTGNVSCVPATSSGNRGSLFNWDGAYYIGNAYVDKNDAVIRGARIKIGNTQAYTIGGTSYSPRVLIGGKSSEHDVPTGDTVLYLPSGGSYSQIVHYSDQSEPDSNWRTIERGLDAYGLAQYVTRGGQRTYVTIPGMTTMQNNNTQNYWGIVNYTSDSGNGGPTASTTSFGGTTNRHAIRWAYRTCSHPITISLNTLFNTADTVVAYTCLKKIQLLVLQDEHATWGGNWDTNALAMRITKTTGNTTTNISSLERHIDKYWAGSEINQESSVSYSGTTVPTLLEWDLEAILDHSERNLTWGQQLMLDIYANGASVDYEDVQSPNILYCNIIAEVRGIHP